MTIIATISSGVRSTGQRLSDRPYFWIASVIIVALVASIAAASIYIDAPVLDGSLVGP